jgi:autotransporter-associated beta strand protein
VLPRTIFVSGSDVVFGGDSTPSTITINPGVGVIANSITVNAGTNYTLGGSYLTDAITLGGGGFTAFENATINAPIILSTNQNWYIDKNKTVNLNGLLSGNYTVSTFDYGTLSINGAGANTGLGLNVNYGSTVLLNQTYGNALGGNATVNAGGLMRIVGTNGDQIADSANVVLQGGALDLNGNSETVNTIRGGGMLTNLEGGPATLTLSGSSIANNSIGGLNALVGGNVSIVKNGGSTFSLNNAANTFTGTITVNGTGIADGGDAHGVFGVRSDAALGNSTNGIELNNGAALFNSTLPADPATGNWVLPADPMLSASRQITLGFGSEVFRVYSNSVFTVNSQVTGPGSLVKTDSGTLILANPGNNYQGSTTIAVNSALQVSHLDIGGNPSSIGMSTNDPSNLVFGAPSGSDPALVYTGTGDTTDRLFTVNSGNSATLINNGTGPLVFSNNNSVVINSPLNGRRWQFQGYAPGVNVFAPQIPMVTSNGTAGTTFWIDVYGPTKWALTNDNNQFGNSGGTTAVNGQAGTYVYDRGWIQFTSIGTYGSPSAMGLYGAPWGQAGTGYAEFTGTNPSFTDRQIKQAAGTNFVFIKSGLGDLTLSGTMDDSSLRLAAVTGFTYLAKTNTGGGVRAVAGIDDIGPGAAVRLAGAGGDQIYNGSTGFYDYLTGGTLDFYGQNEDLCGVWDKIGAGSALANTGTAPSEFSIGQSNGSSRIYGKITNGTYPLSVWTIGTGAQELFSTNSDFTGYLRITAGSVRAPKLGNIGSPSSIGAGDATSDTTNANSLIFNGGTFQYTGTGESTNRLFTIISSTTIASDGTGALVLNSAGANISSAVAPQTGTISTGNPYAITGLASTAGLFVGMPVSGSGVPGSTIITSIDSTAGSIGINYAVTGNSTETISFSGSAARTLTLGGNNTGANLFSSQLTDGGSGIGIVTLLKTGSGVWRVNNDTNTFSGGAQASGGTLEFTSVNNAGFASSLGSSGTITLNSGNTALIPSGTNNMLRYIGGGAATTNRPANLGTAGLDIVGAGSLNLTGTLTQNSGGRTVTKLGTGTLIMSTPAGGDDSLQFISVIAGEVDANAQASGVSSFGNVTLNGGLFKLTSAFANTAIADSSTLTINTGTFDINGVNETVGGVAINGGSIISSAGGAPILTSTGTIVSRVPAPSSVSVPIVLAGANGITNQLSGTLNLQAANTNTGATTIYNGVVNLDFTAETSPASNILPPTATLNLFGGSLRLSGAAGATNSQTLGNPTFSGGGIIDLVPGASGGASLTLGSIWTRNVAGATSGYNGVVQINLPANATVSSSPSFTNGIIPYAVVNTNGVLNFATSNGGNVVGDNGLAYATLPGSGAVATTNYNLIGAGSVTASEIGNAFYIASNIGSPQSLVITAGQSLTLTSGGLLNTSTDAYTITGGSLLGAAGTNGDLIVHQYGSSSLIISSVIGNSGTTGLTKSGPGTLLLNNANQYMGPTSLYGGVLQLTSAANLGRQISRTVQTANSSTTAVVSGAWNDLYVGTPVSGAGIATGTTIAAINGEQLTLSLAATSTTSAAATFGVNNATAMYVSGGTIQYAAPNIWGTGTSMNFLSAAGMYVNGDLTIDSNGNNATIGGFGGNGQGSFTKNGQGILTSGGIGVGGNINVNQGVLRFTGVTVGTGNVTVANGASIDINGQTNFPNTTWFIAGSGYKGWGALYNTGAAAAGQNTFKNITLTGNASIGGGVGSVAAFGNLNRIDLGTGLVNLNGYTLSKVGGNSMLTSATSMIVNGTFDVHQGFLGIATQGGQNNVASTTFQIDPGAAIGWWGYPNTMNFISPITLNGGFLSGSDNGNPSYVNSPITLTANSYYNSFSTNDTHLYGTITDNGAGYGLTRVPYLNAGATAVLYLAGTQSYSGNLTVNGNTIDLQSDYVPSTNNGQISNGVLNGVNRVVINGGDFIYDNINQNLYVPNRLGGATVQLSGGRLQISTDNIQGQDTTVDLTGGKFVNNGFGSVVFNAQNKSYTTFKADSPGTGVTMFWGGGTYATATNLGAPYVYGNLGFPYSYETQVALAQFTTPGNVNLASTSDTFQTRKIIPNVVYNPNNNYFVTFMAYDPTYGVQALSRDNNGYYRATQSTVGLTQNTTGNGQNGNSIAGIVPADNVFLAHSDVGNIVWLPQNVTMNSLLINTNASGSQIIGAANGGSKLTINSGGIIVSENQTTDGGIQGLGDGVVYNNFYGVAVTNPLTVDFNGQTAYFTDFHGDGDTTGREYLVGAKLNNTGAGGLFISLSPRDNLGLRNYQNSLPQITIAGQQGSSGGTVGVVSFNHPSELGGATITLNYAQLGLRGPATTISEPFGIQQTVPNSLNLANSYYNGLLTNNANTILTWSGSVGGAGVLWKEGNGVVVLSNTKNSYSGGTVVDQGVLSINSDAELGAVPGSPTRQNLSVINNAVLQITSNLTLNANRGIMLGMINNVKHTNNTAVGQFDVTGNNTLTYNGQMADNAGWGGQLYKLGTGTMKLGGMNVNAGETYIMDGGLTLDFSTLGAPTSNILYNNQVPNNLNMGSANYAPGWGYGSSYGYTPAKLSIVGASGGNNSQDFMNLVLRAWSHSDINLATSGGGSTSLNFYGPVSFGNTNVTANFSLPSAATTVHFEQPPALVNGIIGNGSTTGWATVNGTDWATINGAGNVAAYNNYSTDTYAPGLNTNVTALNPAPTQFATNTLRFNATQANTVTLSGAGTNTISSGIFVTPNVGANLTSITGGTLASTTGQLFLDQYNTAGDLNINSVLYGGFAIIKTGPGTAILSNYNNNATGSNNAIVYQGTLALAAGGGTGALAPGQNFWMMGGTARLDVNDALGNVASGAPAVVDATPGSTLITKAGVHATLVSSGGVGLQGATIAALGPGDLTNGESYILNTNVNAAAWSTPSVISAAIALSNSSAYNPSFNVTAGAAPVGLDMQGAITNLSLSPLNKTGNGLMRLDAANTYATVTNVYNGTLQLGANGTLPSGTTVNVRGLDSNNSTQTTAVLDMQGYNNTIANLNIGSSFALSGSGNFIAGQSANIAGTGTLTVTGTIRVLNVNNSLITANLAGGGPLVKGNNPSGNLVLTGANSYAGATTLNTGTTVLDFTYPTAPANNILPSATALRVGNASLTMVGKGTSVQTVGSTAINGGEANITLANYAGDTPRLNLGAISRVNYGVANFVLPTGGSMQTSTANTNGILGGWAVATLTPAGSQTSIQSWAARDGSGNIVGLSTYAVNDFTSAANNVDVTGTVVMGDPLTTTVNSLRFNTPGAGSITLQPTVNAPTPTLAIASGGVLVSGNVGSYNPTISGGTIQGSAGGDLVLENYNPSGSLFVSSAIVDNGSATGLTIAGTGGGVEIRGLANTYTGPTDIFSTTARVYSLANNGSLGGGSVLYLNGGNLTFNAGYNSIYGSGNNSSLVTTIGPAGGTLANNSTYASMQLTNLGTISFAGDGDRVLTLGGTFPGSSLLANTLVDPNIGALNLTKTGTGTWILTSNNNTYAGGTTITDNSAQPYSALQIGNGGNTGSFGTGTIAFANNANLVYARSDSSPAINNLLTGAGNLIVKSGQYNVGNGGNGSGNTYTGDTIVMGGRLDIASAQSSGSSAVGSGNVVVDPGALLTNEAAASNPWGSTAGKKVSVYGGTVDYMGPLFAGSHYMVAGLVAGGGGMSGSANQYSFGAPSMSQIDEGSSNSGVYNFYVSQGTTSNNVDLLVTRAFNLAKYGAGNLDITGPNAGGGTLSSINGGTVTLDFGYTFPSINGTMTSGSNVVTGVSPLLGMTTGMQLTGLVGGIPAGTTISSIDYVNGAITLSQNATGSGGNILTAANGTANNLIGNFPLTFNGGTLVLRGSAGVSNTQTIGNLTFNNGADNFTIVPNGASSVILTAGNTWTRNSGAVVNLTVPAGATLSSSPGTTNGIIGGYATFNGNDWATVSGGNLTAYSGYVIYNGLSGSSSASTNVLLAGNGSLTASATVNTLKILPTAGGQSLSTASGRLYFSGNGLLFTGNNAYTINGVNGVAGGPTGTGELIIQDWASQNLTLSSSYQASALTKAGSGTMVLTTVNTGSSAPININGGLVNFTNTNQLGSAAAPINFGGGGLQWGNGVTTTLSGTYASGATTVAVGSSGTVGLVIGMTVNMPNVPVTATITAITGGSITISAATTAGGTSQVGYASWDPTNGKTDTILGGGAILDTNGKLVALGSPFGANSVGALAKVGGGTLNLTANNAANFSGDVYVNGGMLFTGGSNGSTSLGSGPGIYINSGGTLAFNTNTLGSAGHTTALTKNIVITGNGTQGNAVLINTVGNGGRFGNIWLNGGTILANNGITNDGAFYMGTQQNGNLGANSTIFVIGNQPSFIAQGPNSGTWNDITLGPQTIFNVGSTGAPSGFDLTVNERFANQAGDAGGGPGSFMKTGQGTMYLTGDFRNSPFTGGMVVAQGTIITDSAIGNNSSNIVSIGDPVTRPTDTPSLLIGANGTIVNNPIVVNNYGQSTLGVSPLGSGYGPGYTARFSGPITLGATVNLSNPNTDPTASLIVNGGITGKGGVNVNGGGRVVLGGTNTYTGGTTIASGVLQLQSTLPVTSGLLYQLSTAASNGYVLSGSNVIQLNDLSGNGNNFYNASSAVGLISGGTAFNGNNVAYFNFSANSTLTLNKSTTPQMVFIVEKVDSGHTNNDGMFSATGVDHGIRVTTAPAIANPGNANDFTNGGGSMWVNGVLQAGNATAGTAQLLEAAAGNANAFPWAQTSLSNPFNARYFDGDIGEVIAYSGNLSASDRTTIENYLMYKWFGIGSPNALSSTVLPTASPVNITGAGAMLDLNNNIQTISSLSGVVGSQVMLESGVLTTGDSTNTTFAGNISGPGGSLIKTGAGIFTLSGTNTYMGGTTVNNGTLIATNPQALADGSNLYVGDPTDTALLGYPSPIVPSPVASSTPAVQSSIASVPEPSTLGLLALGVVSAALVSRRHRRMLRNPYGRKHACWRSPDHS